jgi:uncharacterized protein (DUF952 family)
VTSSQLAYKVLKPAEWRQLEEDGEFAGSPVDLADGYIHLSTAEQLDGTIATHFAGAGELVIAEVDLGPLGSSVRWESARGGALFPHLYRTLSRSFVRSVEHKLA